MEKLQQLQGVAAPLPRANIDTDIITPMARLNTASKHNMHEYTFEPLRFLADGSENPDFVLNKPGYRGASILIAGRNFGCGSSRETAVWGIRGLGIRCVIAESFGDIFFNNCFQNSVLPIRLPAETVAELMVEAGADQGNMQFQVDVASRTLTTPSGRVITFDLTPDRQAALLEGLDEIAQTLKDDADTTAFQDRDRTARPWIHELGRIE
ncbi:MAG: 3-isopropylmalate dehydratase small subunit [Rhodospirillaceae bacterium]|jgi:3-isopropylmalate/(R)-2-methylmalate dehydratase small subunit|nr:3-isopropylmalate dehydratase small subunit [Rhodospirillaceae bacterium]MBT3781001.1 3-isopropylmalate dehydratase small subunit [Rhodospirillaceae bacterium]MBT3976137.1 3-isopropylmalate dehydratase small subunit [Rhodospirillaceae bacterium]MBT4167461.1 3-isopropylmalate dehydratase small subunit [Rhodospirillaceae bacterium]MBT4561669.1 3-isopropylmalate dehydratase small subunit [Rhodospirillaceae bacterium]